MTNPHRIDLIIPVKSLNEAKTRLRGAADGGTGKMNAHKRLVLAIVLDTVCAALRAQAVDSVLVVTPDPVVARSVERLGARVLGNEPAGGLNAALNHGAALLERERPGRVVGALPADLPALRHRELSAFISAADGRRALCADRDGKGTTLLLSAAGEGLFPAFGIGSALAHQASGAIVLEGEWPSLRSDVDTASDLRTVGGLGFGARMAALGSASEFAFWDKHEAAMIDFARRWQPFGGGTSDDIFSTFGVPPRPYFTQLTALLSSSVTPELAESQRVKLLRQAKLRLVEEDGNIRTPRLQNR
ncbi:2-phospho-L-lactate guanylyltransferase [Rhodococcus opacus]|uniref:2-phospho-L-lactate guanylyltransferase n=2 Tax=Nocardiaceae TaxID=85025 RepID=UPI00146EEDD5|nr:2-phospho-L-lactate guanylyltransferase [Rhodococcus opacus]QZS59142.1 2-phospho-L-lactate guanylyltransferase [Rhodococcus opacus]WKN55353.1 2-phospho-L-lactate guanylyltransferase [Rhodococcus opacus]